MKLQQLYRYVRKAMEDYNMIEDNDKIAVGISGGKDSLALLYALAGMRRFYPHSYELVAITVNLGYEDFDLSPIKRLCGQLGVEYYIVDTEIGKITEEISKKDSPCSICAKMRKGALNDKALELGCNKVAYAHHMDDVIETAFLSMIYEGRFYCFPPVTHLSKTKLTVIRPMIYTPEVNIIGFKNKYQLPIVKNPCPYDGHTRREYVKQLIRNINLDNPGVKNRFFTAIINGKIDGWDLPKTP